MGTKKSDNKSTKGTGNKSTKVTEKQVKQYYGSTAHIAGIDDPSTPTVGRLITIDGVPTLFTAGRIENSETKFHVYAEGRSPQGSLAALVRTMNDDQTNWSYNEAVNFLDGMADSYDHLGDVAELGWNYVGPESGAGEALALEQEMEVRVPAGLPDDDATNDQIDAMLEAIFGSGSPDLNDDGDGDLD